MSDVFLCFAASDPSIEFDAENLEAALDHINREFEPDEMKIHKSNLAQLIIGGEIEHIVKCHICNSNITDEFFGDLLASAYQETGFILDITTPCCGKPISLNDLVFTFANAHETELLQTAGFAKHYIECRNPQRLVTNADITTLTQTLGAPVRAIVMYM